MVAKFVKCMMLIAMCCIVMSQTWGIASLFAVCLGIGMVYILYKIPMKEPYFIAILLVLLLLTRGLSIGILHTPLESDFQLMHTISKEILEGNISTTSHAYMNEYTYQVPYILYQAGLLAVHTDVLFLKMVNVLYSIITVLLVYSIAKKIASKRGSKSGYISVCYSIFPYDLY